MGKKSKQQKESEKRKRSDSSPGTLAKPSKMAATSSENMNTIQSEVGHQQMNSQGMCSPLPVYNPCMAPMPYPYQPPTMNYHQLTSPNQPIFSTPPQTTPCQTQYTGPPRPPGTAPPVQQQPAPGTEQPPSFMIDINKKLDFVIEKMKMLEVMEQNLRGLQEEVKQMKSGQGKMEESIQFMSDRHDTYENSNKQLTNSLTNVDKRIETLITDNASLKQTVTDLQCRSMRDNLVFTGIAESETSPAECETVLKQFLNTQMNITDDIPFERVHRIGRKIDPQNMRRRPRPIVAKFSRFKNRETVRFAASDTLKGKPFGVNEQYPKEVMDTRNKLYPAYRKARHDPHIRARLVVDKLYFNDRLVTVEQAQAYVTPDAFSPRTPSMRAPSNPQDPVTSTHPASTNNRFHVLNDQQDHPSAGTHWSR